MEAPKVSIIIPVFNGSDYVSKAIDSALAQSYRNFEVVVVNDGSKDAGRTDQICKGYGDRIRYFSKENGGVASALNKGISEAKGEYLCWLSHDDEYPPGRLESQLARMLSYGREKNIILYGNYEIIDKDGVIYDVFRNPPVPPSRFYESLLCFKVYVKPFRSEAFVVNGCTLMIPRRAFDEIGMFDESLRTTQDYQMWFRLCRSYDFIQMEEPLLRSRRHSAQGTRTMYSRMRLESDEVTAQALNIYKPGDSRTDLDLCKVAFALKTNLNNATAFKKVIPLALSKDEKTLTDATYILGCVLWNRYMTMARTAIRLGKLELKRMAANRSMK